VELLGTWQTAQVGTGNLLNSQVNTQNTVVRTEAMTLRIWRARIESVTFGKDAPRQITAMFSTDTEARALAHHLTAFGQSRASMVTPSSPADQQAMQGLAEVAARLDRPHPQGAALPLHCLHCGGQLPAGARFCPHCGQAQGT
jgi:hypothetical protein